MAAVRVLVVDDEPGLRTTLAANLELEGFEVVEAESGAHALALAQEDGTFDVVLTDIRMPGMNGVELFHALQKARPGLPVILSTAFALEDLTRDALQAGAFTLLPKPSDVEHVAATLSRAARKPFVILASDPSWGQSCATAMREAGLRVEYAPGTEEAIHRATDEDVDVCVIEVARLGPDAVRELQRRAPKLALVAVFGRVGELKEQVPGAGAVVCLRQPVEPRELVQIVAESRGKPPRRS
jgi:DNA-binding NtrC family response regulator